MNGPPPAPRWEPGMTVEEFRKAIEKWRQRVREWVEEQRHHHRRPHSVTITVGSISPKGKR